MQSKSVWRKQNFDFKRRGSVERQSALSGSAALLPTAVALEILPMNFALVNQTREFQSHCYLRRFGLTARFSFVGSWWRKIFRPVNFHPFTEILAGLIQNLLNVRRDPAFSFVLLGFGDEAVMR